VLNPNNPYGIVYFVGFYQNDEVIGFCMFGYYTRRRVIVIDHMAIDAVHRKHRAFYVFAALLQEFIEERCPDFDFILAEIATDPAYPQDDVSGVSLIWLARQLGFGRVQAKYFLANMEPRSYRHKLRAALMLRGPQKISKIRAEDLVDLHQVILFEHYLPWFEDFIGDLLPTYKQHLVHLHAEFRKQFSSKDLVQVNGSKHDELAERSDRKFKTVFGLRPRTVGHFALFVLLLSLVTIVQWFLALGERGLLIFSLCTLLVFSGVIAMSDARAFRVFDKLGAILLKLISRK
jgi:hypothetical protein